MLPRFSVWNLFHITPSCCYFCTDSILLICAFKGHQKKCMAGSRCKCIFKAQMYVGQREAANPTCTAPQEPTPGTRGSPAKALHACNGPGDTPRARHCLGNTRRFSTRALSWWSQETSLLWSLRRADGRLLLAACCADFVLGFTGLFSLSCFVRIIREENWCHKLSIR